MRRHAFVVIGAANVSADWRNFWNDRYNPYIL
jgi:hypothetical protein